MTEKTSLIPARLKSAVVGGHVTGAADIIDDDMNKTQDVINQEAAGDIEDIKELIPEEATSENQLADKAYVATEIGKETTRATTAEGVLQDNIDAEETRAKAAEGLLDGRLDAVEEVIPSAATSTNQLADKSFVNSSISTATATFRGTSATGLTETEFLTWANTLTKDNNDYVFWNTADAAGTPQFKKYKYNGTAWVYEYTLNNSSFTADQWATINSLLTSAHKTKLDALPTNAELTTLFAGKEDVISDLATIRSGAALGATAYQKPSTGIPSTDLTSGVQTSLGKADTAVQPSDLATVATSGSYNDLTDKPSIPSGQIQSDWNQTNTSEADFIKNKPTNVSAFTNDAGYLTEHQSLDNYYNKTQTDNLLDDKQDTLVSGTNIKTINNNSILGSGNIDIQTGSTYTGGNGIDITNDEISVKAGSNLSFDANGNLNATDTTYSVMGGSGASHASGLVPDPGATAGTTKYLREDGTWQEVIEVVQTTGQSTTAVMSQKAVSDLIPAQASSSNKLADKEFVNSSITTATAEIKGSATSACDTLGEAEALIGANTTAISNEATARANAVSAEAARAQAAEEALDGRVDTLEEAVGSGGSVDNRIAAAKTEVIGGATSNGNTLKKLEDRLSPVETAVGTGGSVDSRISAAVATETTRAQGAESTLNSGKADKATTLAGYGITDAYTKSETYTKTEVNGLVDTPHQEYVTVATYASLPASGSKDTIYRVSNYNGSTSQVDASVYSEYAWNGSQYIFLCVKSQIGEVFDISVYNNNAKYADLAAALNGGANIPQSLQKGGMSVKFVQSSDNKYVQYRLMSDTFNTTPDNWQGVDEEPTLGSNNLVKSGGVFDSLVSGGIIDEEPTTKTIGGAQGQQYIPFEFKKGVRYKMVFTPTTNATLQVVFTSSTESTDTKVDDLSNIVLEANNPITINYTPSNDANYFHYWCSSSFNCELKIIDYVQTNIRDLINEGYLYKGIAIPTTNPQTPKTKVFYLATQAGTYTNFLDSNSTPIVVVQGLSVIKFNGTAWSVEQVFDIDDKPTAGSDNLVKSGGVFESFVKGGIIDEELKKRVSIEYGGQYIPFEFVSGKEYIIRFIPSSNATLRVVFTSTTESTETKIDQFDNITLVANEIQEIKYIPSADANYWHYYCDAADLSCTIEIIQYVQNNVNDKISPIKEIADNLSYEVYGTNNVSVYDKSSNREDYCVTSGGIIIRNIYAKYVVSGYIPLPDNWTKIKLESLIDGGGSRYCRLSETTNDNEVGYADGVTGTEKEIVYNSSFANYKYLTFTVFAAQNGTPVPDLSGIKVYLYKDGLEERVTTLEEENTTPDKMSFSKRCFDFGQKSPQKPCVTITFDVLDNFSFGTNKDLFDYINFLKGYGIPASSFFIRPTAGQIGNVADYVNAYKIGQDICIHSIHTDSFGDNDTENPHPSLADAETILQNYQKWFKTNGFPYSMGWVTSRGLLYAPYFDLLPKYIGYGHTLANHDIKGASDVSDLYPYINKRTDDKMEIIRLGIENLQADGDADETKIINYTKALIDKTIETNGFLCLYGHGFDNMSAPYTMRESVLTGILTYLKTKIDNLEILVGSEAEIVPYFYE